MTYKKQGQKLHTDDATLPRSLSVEARFQPIRTTTQIWVAMRHQYGISVLVSQTLFSTRETTSCGVTKCKLFSLAILPGFSSKTGAICHWRDVVSILCTTLLNEDKGLLESSCKKNRQFAHMVSL